MAVELYRPEERTLMDEPGLARHVAALDRRLAADLTASYTGVDAARIACYVARGRDLRARWWMSRLRRLRGWLGRGRPGARRAAGDGAACCEG